MLTRAISSVCIVLLLAAPSNARAAEQNIVAVVAAAPPALGGHLSATWRTGTHAQLKWDWQFARSADKETDVYALRDGAYLYVGFDAKQSGTIAASQQTNDIGEGSDDEVEVLLWPAGADGQSYRFAATPAGTRYESSTENTAFRPQWIASGSIAQGEYTVTMRIPLAVLHGDGRSVWNVQFARFVQGSGQWLIWRYAPGVRYDNVVSAGTIANMPQLAHVRARPKSRVGLYELQRIGNSPLATTSASSMGADVSIPITAQSSFVGTFHPDYSNVEQDQQTIAPTAFTRTLAEVRPFFTQGASAYTKIPCTGCSPFNFQELYTPSIPTPSQGYALEGAQGTFQFGSFDAIGVGRNDSAEAVTYKSGNQRFSITHMGIQSNQIDFHDATDINSISYSDQHHFTTFLDYGTDRGTAVADPQAAQRYEAGVVYNTPTDSYDFEMRKIGAYYNPADGIMPLNDIAGYHLNAQPSVVFGPAHTIQSIQLFTSVSHYSGSTGGTNLAEAYALVQLNFKHQMDLQVASYSSAVRFPGDVLRPANDLGGFEFDYRKGTATPCTLAWGPGNYGEGYLNAWTRLCGFNIGRRTTINLEADDTDWYGAGQRLKQWLERASFTYALGPDSSLSVGVRKITGAPPPISTTLPVPAAETNISLAFTRHNPHSDLFVVYGDAAALSTLPTVIVKFVFYAGAEKGT